METPPANVLVAVVEVAVNDAAGGVGVATMLPEPSVERRPHGIEVIASADVLAIVNEEVPEKVPESVPDTVTPLNVPPETVGLLIVGEVIVVFVSWSMRCEGANVAVEIGVLAAGPENAMGADATALMRESKSSRTLASIVLTVDCDTPLTSRSTIRSTTGLLMMVCGGGVLANVPEETPPPEGEESPPALDVAVKGGGVTAIFEYDCAAAAGCALAIGGTSGKPPANEKILCKNSASAANAEAMDDMPTLYQRFATSGG